MFVGIEADDRLSCDTRPYFSSDGKYLSVTQFGPAVFDNDGNLTSFGNERRDSVAIYRMK